ncbi:hypothetical protein [Arcobacter aquimarinus]|uniref:Transglutaminase-like domain-containing protein n=1 Tax=Arcobacter aquimarinus TaxID=1315211 RepID=A0AAE7B7G9_9BACT|nr:hypothetical protein [Arcobacter aquimarinus]QKE27027.1 hypothetical protein AAQM_2330 [Arcobacter aquimarinus]RXI36906.1 hypothetical protein CP986_00190 [Arcobacter aquimarinus]
MLINNRFLKYFSFLLSAIFIIYVIYLIVSSFFIVKNQFIDIGDATYVNQVRKDDYTKKLALYLTKDCQNDKLCEVQSMLDFVTAIPYKINESVARSPKNVVEQNFGDCDDKSNLLISLLKVSGYEKVYFVLVPEHIFVIINFEDIKLNKKALYVNDKPFYILESTAQNSKIGFPLKYKLDEISAIVDPFVNKKLVINKLEYKY